MEQRLTERAMAFTLLLESFLRGDTFDGEQVSETYLVDKMYALRAAIVREEDRQRGAAA